MSIFTKPISQLDTFDLQALLDDSAVENVRLEFKAQVPKKDETLKKLSSFANTYGGFMVVGAAASSEDGRISDLPGVEAESGYKQTIIQWCFGGASPPLTAEVSDAIPTPSGNGKVCYVVYIPESDVAPHFLNGRKGVYIRTDEFSARFEAHLANENEMRLLWNRRAQVLERRGALFGRARRRFGTHANRKYATPNASNAKLGSRLELSISPRFPARPLIGQSQLEDLLMKNLVIWRGTSFPRISSSVVHQHESVILLQAAEQFSIFEANIWGMLFYGTEIDTNERGIEGIHLYHVVGYVLAALDHAGGILKAVGYSGPIVIETGLASILAVPWLTSPGGHMIVPRKGSQLDDDVLFTVTLDSEMLHDKIDGAVLEVLRSIFFSANLAGLAGTDHEMEALLRQGYEYNFWPVPSQLKF